MDNAEFPVIKTTIACIIGLVLLIGICVAGAAGCASYNRYQKRADATNQVKVTHILIQKAKQQAEINQAQIAATRAEAQKRYVAAVGIKRAQDEIQSTLTPLYVQFEAIEAQKAIATSGQNNTVIYVPAGTNGTPVITSNPQHPRP